MIPRLTLLPLFLFAASLIAREGDFRDQGPGRVFFYSEPNFQGECLVVEGDAAMFDLANVRDSRGRKWDDRIASIRTEGPVRVILFEDPRYRGDQLEVSRPIVNLRLVRHGETGLENWDRRVSALKVETFFEHRGPGPEPHFRDQRAADRAITAAYRDILGRNPDYSGFQNARTWLLDRGWSDEQLRESLRNSREFRDRDVEAIVRRCYRDILKRSPDPDGMRTFCRALREQRWTENELRNELLRSDEARDRVSREIVIRAYRDILGREPDQDGMSHCMGKMREGWTEQRLRDSLRNSNEFKQKSGRR